MDRWSQLHRREVLRMVGGALTAAAAAPLLAACSSGRDRSSTSATTSPSTQPFDTTRPWWLQGNFAPVDDEVETFDLAVVGALPNALTGVYVRNGSNPRTGTSPHWFLGDGMVHGVRLEAGRAHWYRNRFVRTPLYEGSLAFGSGVPGGASSQSNVSVFTHGGRLLSSGEIGLPYELSPIDLSTVGVHDFNGRLATSMTAHPKRDPVTGLLHFFGYGFTPPYLTYHVADADGTLVMSTEIPVKGATMIHDFAITETDAIFWELPVVFDLDAAIAMVQGKTDGAFPFRWDPAYGARVGILPLGGQGSETKWFDLDPCYVFHGVNAFRKGDAVVVDVCRLASMFDNQLVGGALTLRRWTIDTATGRVTDDVLADHDPGELPTRDPRVLGRPQRHAYLVQSRERPETFDLGGLIKHDFTTGQRDVWDPGPALHGGEWLFVPDPEGSSADDDGWVLGFVHDETTDATDFVVIDASAVSSGPVASVRLPRRVPYGFHAAWVAG